ncbi:MAG: hypothetical protein KDA75_03215 [Planctomycetaceae bacterium]|nr:hypothetical protein [Planctomycetaceae bacterium]
MVVISSNGRRVFAGGKGDATVFDGRWLESLIGIGAAAGQQDRPFIAQPQ